MLQPTDIVVSTKFPVVAGATLARGGLQRRPAIHELAVAGVAARPEDRLAHLYNEFTGCVPDGPINNFAFNADCEKAWFGWPCDSELEKLRDAFPRR